MARYRTVDPKVHTDSKILRLSPARPSGQALWMYLLTAPENGPIPGLLRIGEASLAESIYGHGWPLRDLRRCWRELEREGIAKADWRSRVVWLLKGLTYNPPKTPNHILSWRHAWEEIPDCGIKTEVRERLLAICAEQGPVFAETFRYIDGVPGAKPPPKSGPNRRHNSGPNNRHNNSQDQDQDQDQDQEQDQDQDQERAQARARRNFFRKGKPRPPDLPEYEPPPLPPRDPEAEKAGIALVIAEIEAAAARKKAAENEPGGDSAA